MPPHTETRFPVFKVTRNPTSLLRQRIISFNPSWPPGPPRVLHFNPERLFKSTREDIAAKAPNRRRMSAGPRER